ncbi:hemin-degrading factor [Herbaspirillum seropedicae]|uniref:hemin-degrading factor n=1 Tax=Herbaspirillum seropedicae TaxID=964 RepID=UPI0031D1DA06
MKHRSAPTLLLPAALTLALALAGCAANPPTLSQRWTQLQQAQPRLHLREAAHQLGVSEAELLASDANWQATRLTSDARDIQALYERLAELGRIKAVIRNDDVMLERTGALTPARRDEQGRVVPGTGLAGGPIAGLAGGPIDLRIGGVQWGSAFAVAQQGRDGKTLRSLQFFDQHGQAIHKIYLDNDEHIAAYERLVAEFRIAGQPAPLIALPAPTQPPAAVRGTASAADVAQLRQAWTKLTDVHQFPRLLRELKLSREQALQLIGDDSAWRISAQGLQLLMDDARARRQPIMAFVSQGGMTQIYSGMIDRSSNSGAWYEVLGEDFRLKVRSAAIDHGWVVRRPTDHGMVTSVEFYDAAGRQLVNFFSRRDRGQPETAQWRRMVEALPRS